MKKRTSMTGFLTKIKLALVLMSCMWFSLACNDENAPDCFQNAGPLERIEVELPEFSRITVFENLNLVLKQGAEQKVELESGRFLLNDLVAKVEGDRLLVSNDNGCNLFREFGISTVYVTAPNITQIRSSTGLLISSDGPLSYPALSLVSESFVNPDSETTDGSFDLQFDNTAIEIFVNGIAYFKLSGRSPRLDITIAAGDSRIETDDLMADQVIIDHRGTNDVIVNPQLGIEGVIRGYGDVISLNRPATIAVEELFEGRLIFRD
ncbi:head GIN domain-containing protein [Flagellimonas sp. DF-77]|uniref:head GIN domain-containing protein n=1 Tax=Flagellimonas algarum TaxID=3230298 RepID=UPI00339B9104